MVHFILSIHSYIIYSVSQGTWSKVYGSFQSSHWGLATVATHSHYLSLSLSLSLSLDLSLCSSPSLSLFLSLPISLPLSPYLFLTIPFRLLSEEQEADVTLCVGSARLRVHRAVLLARAAHLLKGAPPGQSEVLLQDCDAAELREFIRYVCLCQLFM